MLWLRCNVLGKPVSNVSQPSVTISPAVAGQAARLYHNLYHRPSGSLQEAKIRSP